VHLVGFIIRIYHDSRSHEHQTACIVTNTFYTLMALFLAKLNFIMPL